MVRFSYLLKPRWELFRRHDERLRHNPDPKSARQKFKKRLRDARRTQKARLACFLGLYFSAILTAVGAVVAAFGDVAWLESALGALGGVMSSLALVFLAGVFVTTRALSYIEVDLYFYSQESRSHRHESPKAAALLDDGDEKAAQEVPEGFTKRVSRGRRVYTRTPVSSYRP